MKETDLLMYTSLGRWIFWRRTWLKDAHQDTEQGVVKEDIGEKISSTNGHHCGSKICRGQKTLEGRYACCRPFNWRMALFCRPVFSAGSVSDFSHCICRPVSNNQCSRPLFMLVTLSRWRRHRHFHTVTALIHAAWYTLLLQCRSK